MNIRTSFGKKADVATQCHFFSVKKHWVINAEGEKHWSSLIMYERQQNQKADATEAAREIEEVGMAWTPFFANWFGYYKSRRPGRAHYRQGCRHVATRQPTSMMRREGLWLGHPLTWRLWAFVSKPVPVPLRTAQGKSRICSLCSRASRYVSCQMK